MTSANFIVADTTALEDKGVYFSRVSTDMTPAGTDVQEMHPVHVAPQTPGRNPRAGIAYIDQAIGGITQLRLDAMAGSFSGIRPASVRRAPMNGDFIARSIPLQVRTQGNVGLSRRGTSIRATAQQSTNVPDQGKVVAAFTNPALASLLSRWSGR